MNDNASMRQRALAVLRGEMPARLPFITRLEAWYKSHTRNNTLPEPLRGLTLDEVHAAVGVGRLKFSSPFGLRLRGVDVQATFNGEPHYHAHEPVIENFPGMWDIVPTDRAGETITELITPQGRLVLRHKLLPENVRTGTDPYLVRHLLQSDEDFPALEYILDRAEVVPLDQKVRDDEAQVGEHGLVVPLLYRIPFQQLLLEYLGETRLFAALHAKSARVRQLMDLLDLQMMQLIDSVATLDVPYVEFPDNLHGPMTSPRLFQEFCLPAYQKYCAALHAQGKKVGSHTDGNMKPLLGLLPLTSLGRAPTNTIVLNEPFASSEHALVTLRGVWGWALFGIVWAMAVMGVVFKCFFTGRLHALSTAAYVLMGWIAVVAIRPLWQALPWSGFLLVLAGGVLYTSGVVFFAGRWRYSHTIWHLFVLAGSICHFDAVYLYVLPR